MSGGVDWCGFDCILLLSFLILKACSKHHIFGSELLKMNEVWGTGTLPPASPEITVIHQEHFLLKLDFLKL